MSCVILGKINYYYYKAGDLRRYRAHYDVIVMIWWCSSRIFHFSRWHDRLSTAQTKDGSPKTGYTFTPVTGSFPSQRPLSNAELWNFFWSAPERLSKQTWGWWFEAQSRSLWRHYNVRRFRISYLVWNLPYFGSNFIEINSQEANKQSTGTGLENGLAPKKHDWK